jgi:hypothetical protein
VILGERGYAVRHALHLLMLTAVLLCGCGRDHRAFTTVDSWYRPPSTQLLLAEGWEDLGKDNFAVVTVKEAEALGKLEESPWVKLSQSEAEEFLGRPLDGVGGQLILLRALSLNERTGGFTVKRRKGAVQVHHNCLGRGPVPMIRRALVARLPEVPSEVYVHCNMDE